MGIATVALLLGAMAATGVFAQSDSAVEVRIAARAHDDGRVEFAVQPRDGIEWGDRIVPRGRFLPAAPPVGRWLYSTPVTVGELRIGSGVVPFPVPDGAVEISGKTSTEIEFEVSYDDLTGTTETIIRTEYGDWGDAARMMLICNRDGSFQIGIRYGYGFWGGEDRITWRIDGGLSKTETWGEYGSTSLLSTPNPRQFLRELRGAREFVFIIDSDDESQTISIAGLLDTPAQPNVDRCGTY